MAAAVTLFSWENRRRFFGNGEKGVWGVAKWGGCLCEGHINITEAHASAPDPLVLPCPPTHLPTCGGCVARGGAFARLARQRVAAGAAGRYGATGGVAWLQVVDITAIMRRCIAVVMWGVRTTTGCGRAGLSPGNPATPLQVVAPVPDLRLVGQPATGEPGAACRRQCGGLRRDRGQVGRC